jgi:hypothetical protein
VTSLVVHGDPSWLAVCMAFAQMADAPEGFLSPEAETLLDRAEREFYDWGRHGPAVLDDAGYPSFTVTEPLPSLAALATLLDPVIGEHVSRRDVAEIVRYVRVQLLIEEAGEIQRCSLQAHPRRDGSTAAMSQ